LFAVGVTTAP